MKKIFVTLIVSLFLCNFVNAQSVYNTIKSKLDQTIRDDSKSWNVSKYRGGLTLTDVTESGNILVCKGTFKYKVLGTGTIYYTAHVKMILDELVIKKIWWVQPYTNATYVIGGY